MIYQVGELDARRFQPLRVVLGNHPRLAVDQDGAAAAFGVGVLDRRTGGVEVGPTPRFPVVPLIRIVAMVSASSSLSRDQHGVRFSWAILEQSPGENSTTHDLAVARERRP